MTLIEFYDNDSIENICTSFSEKPEKVFLLGKDLDKMEAAAKRYEEILSKRGIKTAFECRKVGKNNLNAIIKALEEIVDKNSDCVVDLTGGDDLFLVAAGIVAQKSEKKNLRLHRYDISTNKVTYYSIGMPTEKKIAESVTVEENIRIYGGGIKYETPEDPEGTVVWDLNEEFKQDIKNIWDICRVDVKAWNKTLNVFDLALDLFNGKGLTVKVSNKDLKAACEDDGGRYRLDPGVITELKSKGLITNYQNNSKDFSITFKNEQVKKCLSKAGTALEMIIYLAATEATKNADGSPVYTDVKQGVYIDWDGILKPQGSSTDDGGTNNEVDVIMTRSMTPIFVSCKNGWIDSKELDRLNELAYLFGGKYAKRVLVATALGLGADQLGENSIRERAEDMEIKLVETYNKEDIRKLDYEKMKLLVKSF